MIGDIHLPSVLAVINAATVVVLALGYYFIRNGKKDSHRAVMICAGLLGVAFMIVYATYHLSSGFAKFGGEGWIRTFYLSLLWTHIIAATIALPVVPYTIYLGLSGRYKQHRRLARWTWPLWFFVATSGLVIYQMVMVIWPDTGA